MRIPSPVGNTLCVLTLVVIALATSVFPESSNRKLDSGIVENVSPQADRRPVIDEKSKIPRDSNPSTKSTTQFGSRCIPELWQRPDLSGKYDAVLFADKNDKIGNPVVLKIEGSSFTVVSDNTAGEGKIGAIDKCGHTDVTLKFDSLSGTLAKHPEFTQSSISLEARQVGADPSRKYHVTSLRTSAPIVLATKRGAGGMMEGPDIAILVCPAYPECLKYPRCPCPDPNK
jgi:hypothetical protein